ncbi:MAG: hypothetical protein SPD54_06430 [Parabacteroides sp.]|nr:hypothetical protein [Parabacteroides sp.]
MQSRQTLALMFEANKQALETELTGLTLPQDAKKIQEIVSTYFDSLLNQNGEYRQNLSQSEDYILQAALSLLNAQQEMGRKLAEKKIEIKTKVTIGYSQEEQKSGSASSSIDSTINKILSQKDNTKTILGAGGGAILGKMALGSGWGALFGAIAGTAIMLYMTNQTEKKSKTEVKPIDVIAKPKVEAVIENTPINVPTFLDIISQTCDSIDTLIGTFRNQIQKVVNKYESQEKPTLEREYGLLLEAIQSLVGVAYAQQSDEKRLAKIDERLEQLVDALENYSLEIVSYSDEKKDWFDLLQSNKVDTPTMICPAIIKNGIIVKRGKVFIKE